MFYLKYVILANIMGHLSREREIRERERDNFIEINRKHDDTCTNKNYNEGLCGLIQGDLR